MSLDKSSSGDSANVDAQQGHGSIEIIRLGFIISGTLASLVVILSAVNGFRQVDSQALAVVGSVISGLLGFLAGRKR